MSVTFDEKLASLGAEVPNATVPGANYIPAVVWSATSSSSPGRCRAVTTS
jgi:hypothetical protein